MENKIKKQGFKIPEEYFEKSKASTLNSIVEIATLENRNDTIKPKRSNSKVIQLFLRYGSIAACLAIGWLFTNQYLTDDSAPHEPELSYEYIDYLMDNSEVLSIDDLSEFSGLMVEEVIEDEELLNYLHEADLEDILELI